MYSTIADSLALNAEEFQSYAYWSTEKYTRICISRTAEYELLLLCWSPGQKTPIHCHGGEECWVSLIEGQLQEQVFQLEGNVPLPQKKEILNGLHISHMNDHKGLHVLTNVGDTKAMSLHLYVGPIDQCDIWDEDLQKMVPRILTYDAEISLAVY